MNKLKKIYVIVGHGTSDIGKGWLTSGIGSANPEKTLPIKIDPFFSLKFPKKIGESIVKLCTKEDINNFIKKNKDIDPLHYIISDDFIRYKDVGMRILPESNILGGNILKEFLETEADSELDSRSKKTFADISNFLAKKITTLVNEVEPEVLLIEIGGTIEDNEQLYIVGALRLLELDTMLGITPEILLLTYFDYSEVEIEPLERIKTRYIQQGIRTVQKNFFGLPFNRCLVRRRSVPFEIKNIDLEKQFKKIAFETQFNSDKIKLLPHIKWEEIDVMTKFIKNIDLI